MKNSMIFIRLSVCLIIAFVLLPGLYGCRASESCTPSAISGSPQWFKGNTHCHSFWSDGKWYPEMVVDWYKSHGYGFLVLSDHNLLSQGQKWVELKNAHVKEGIFDDYLDRFGDNWIETRIRNDKKQVRVKPLNEFRHLYEEAGRFMLIQGEEVTPKGGHVNAINTIEAIGRQEGKTIREKLQKSIDLVLEQEKRYGQEMLPHVNHPNWKWHVTAEDIMHLTGEQFFEVYNGCDTDSDMYGDPNHPGQERMWDIVLAMRLGVLDMPVMYGLATDDTHVYHKVQSKGSNPGRGWIMVRARYLTPEHIIKAMEAGDFYASSGVTLKDIQFDGKQLSIKIDPEPGASYETQFIGTLKNFNSESHERLDKNGKPLNVSRVYSDDIGRVLKTVKGTTPSYKLKGDELYVRAKVISNKPMKNTAIQGMTKTAWTQPALPAQ